MDNLGEVCSHGRLERRCTECKYEELLTKYEVLGAEYEELSLYAEDLRTKYLVLRNSVLGPSLRTGE